MQPVTWLCFCFALLCCSLLKTTEGEEEGEEDKQGETVSKTPTLVNQSPVTSHSSLGRLLQHQHCCTAACLTFFFFFLFFFFRLLSSCFASKQTLMVCRCGENGPMTSSFFAIGQGSFIQSINDEEGRKEKRKENEKGKRQPSKGLYR